MDVDPISYVIWNNIDMIGNIDWTSMWLLSSMTAVKRMSAIKPLRRRGNALNFAVKSINCEFIPISFRIVRSIGCFVYNGPYESVVEDR